ncbi:MAG TPA: CopD family protein, partial [Solirubrobacteraceae bacterium]|nr:CopD family protein [Solirubrobacteraceae bacterium]
MIDLKPDAAPRARARARRRVFIWFALAVIAVGVAGFAAAPAAFAHAQLLGTSPQPGSTVPTQPAEVIFKFNQSVGGTLGAVRVYDAQGGEVDNLDVSHPQGQEHWMGIGLKPGLPDGTYTATYRVISADTHIVYGGLVFSIGHAGPAPKFTVTGLIGRNSSGETTKLAFGVVRALDYLSIALMIGGLAFLLVAWLPGLSVLEGSEPGWQAACGAFARRFQRLLLVAVVLGALVSVLGFLLQGASAAGVSLWASLKGTILENTLDSRFGKVWGARAIDWLLIGLLLLSANALERPIAPSPGIDGNLSRRPPRWTIALLGLGAGYLAITPALAGHASIERPVWVFFASDALHVLAASVWVGGIACLLLALPSATRELHGGGRTQLLLGTLARFSPLALAAVIAIAVSGVVQAYIDVRSLQGLLHTTYGALILVKIALLLALIGLGFINRERVIPALKRIMGTGRSPGDVGVLARSTLRGELALMLCVFGVTAALISYAPPIDAASGPFSTNATLGP